MYDECIHTPSDTNAVWCKYIHIVNTMHTNISYILKYAHTLNTQPHNKDTRNFFTPITTYVWLLYLK